MLLWLVDYLEKHSDSFVQPNGRCLFANYQLHKIVGIEVSWNAEPAFSYSRLKVKQILVNVNIA